MPLVPSLHTKSPPHKYASKLMLHEPPRAGANAERVRRSDVATINLMLMLLIVMTFLKSWWMTWTGRKRFSMSVVTMGENLLLYNLGAIIGVYK